MASSSTPDKLIKRLPRGGYDYGNNIRWPSGMRVEISPHLDLWMRGAKYGVTRGVTADGRVKVKMENSNVKEIQYFRPEDIRSA